MQGLHLRFQDQQLLDHDIPKQLLRHYCHLLSIWRFLLYQQVLWLAGNQLRSLEGLVLPKLSELNVARGRVKSKSGGFGLSGVKHLQTTCFPEFDYHHLFSMGWSRMLIKWMESPLKHGRSDVLAETKLIVCCFLSWRRDNTQDTRAEEVPSFLLSFSWTYLSGGTGHTTPKLTTTMTLQQLYYHDTTMTLQLPWHTPQSFVLSLFWDVDMAKGILAFFHWIWGQQWVELSGRCLRPVTTAADTELGRKSPVVLWRGGQTDADGCGQK